MKRIFRKSENGVVGIVVAVLFIGLMVTVVSLIQMVYVPKWMEQKEAEHMDVVDAQFSQLKFAIDTQSSTGQLNIPIATSITLGSKELPYLMSLRSFGQLEIKPASFKINITNITDSYEYLIGTIEYSSSNAYYLDQSFIYEAGAIITSQEEGNMISIKPSIYLKNVGENQEILIDLPDINSIGGKTTGSGYGSTAIQTECVGFDNIIIEGVNRISITTHYTNAWMIYYDWILKSVLDSSDYSLTVIGNEIIIQFFNSPNLDLTIANINAQIGAGWVEYS
ncbi:MAG: hypothetical protein AYK22_08120 [Thermoplasmatales archaeon SG8-52-3]|nr:MAG: hypothetical protein AYK22_08120 [Thermoplasmatales archaeon SG8-52-3]